MKINIRKRTTVALVIVLAATILMSMAATAEAGNACSFARAAGKYGTSDSGMVVGIGPRAADALLTLDAAGNISGPATASLNGSVTHSKLSGTYTVNRDCRGAASFSEFDQSGNVIITATVDFVGVDNMREILFIFTSATLTAHPLGPCSMVLRRSCSREPRKCRLGLEAAFQHGVCSVSVVSHTGTPTGKVTLWVTLAVTVKAYPKVDGLRDGTSVVVVAVLPVWRRSPTISLLATSRSGSPSPLTIHAQCPLLR